MSEPIMQCKQNPMTYLVKSNHIVFNSPKGHL